jgi:hypothetical protein
LYYGVSGSLLAIGQDRAQVLAALQARASGGLAADEKLAARLAGPREVSAIGTWQWGASLEAAFLAQAKAIAGAEVSVVEPIGPGGLPAVPAAPEMPADPLKDPVGWLRKIAGLAEPEPEDPEASVRRAQAAEARAWRELGASLKGVPPVVVVVSRTPEEFRLELRQPGLPAIAPRLIDRGGEWYRRWQHQVFPPVIEDALINAPIGIGR